MALAGYIEAWVLPRYPLYVWETQVTLEDAHPIAVAQDLMSGPFEGNVNFCGVSRGMIPKFPVQRFTEGCRSIRVVSSYSQLDKKYFNADLSVPIASVGSPRRSRCRLRGSQRSHYFHDNKHSVTLCISAHRTRF